MAQKKGWDKYSNDAPRHWDKRQGDPNQDRYHGKEGTDHMQMGGPGGFQSGLRAFKEDMNKKGKKYEFGGRNEA